MSSWTVSEARAALPRLLDQVEHGDQVSITRHGRVVAVLVSPSTVRSERVRTAFEGAARVRDLLAHADPLADLITSGLSPEQAERLVDEVRLGRDAR